MNLPEYFCWTRFGTEAAQTVEQIFSRKEEERLANDGKFLWGVGNAVGPSVRELLRRTSEPEALFSPIKAPAKVIDAAPTSVAAWTSGEALDGTAFTLPRYSLVTSRYDPSAPGRVHYALVCRSDQPLALSGTTDGLHMCSLRNLVTGRPVGASQVTAIVQQRSSVASGSAPYPVAVRAKLVAPYFIRLRGPVPLAEGYGSNRWSDIVRSLWERRLRDASNGGGFSEALQQKLAFVN